MGNPNAKKARCHLMSGKTKKQAYLEYVMRLALRVWDDEIAEFRVMKNRNGVSVLPTRREFFTEGDKK